MTALQGLVRIERAERHDIDGPGTVRVDPELPVTVTIVNLSRSGCLFKGRPAPAIGSMLSIGIPGIGARSARVVRSAPEGVGVAFLSLLSEQELGSALAADSQDEGEPSRRIRDLRRAQPVSERPAGRHALRNLLAKLKRSAA